MASIRVSHRKNGTPSYAVLFRHHGAQTSKTFDTHDAAQHFVKMLDVLGPTQALEMAETPSNAMTLDQLAERWLAWKKTRVRSDRTVADYQRDYINWISPHLGNRPAGSIDEADVQDLVDHMARTLSPKSVADRHALLHGMFKWANAPSRRLVVGDPCIGTELPERRKTPPKGLRPNEWRALHAALTVIDHDAADLAEFLLATGWRWSEGAALAAFDVEDDGQDLRVTMSHVIRRNAAGQHVIVGDAKSEAGMRRVKLDAEAAEMVRRRVGNRVDGLVFTTASGAQWHYSNFVDRAWKPAVAAAGLGRKPTPHWLRHTHVGWMILGGHASLSELQRRLGHASISTTNDVYGRMIEDVSPEALDGFAAMRRGNTAPQLST